MRASHLSALVKIAVAVFLAVGIVRGLSAQLRATDAINSALSGKIAKSGNSQF